MKLSSFSSPFCLCLGILLYLAGFSYASAATLTVDEYSDGPESGNTSGTCNLREAIQAVNDGADIAGDCTGVGVYGTADEIQFSGTFPQTYTLTWDTGVGFAHPLILDNDVTITGPGSGSLTIDGNAEAGIFLLGAQFSGTGIDIDLSGVTLTDGNALLTSANYFYHGGQGGAIHGQAGSTITLDDVIISSNVGGQGGGIFADDNSTITISDSQIISNDATVSRGGGMFIDEGSTLTITTTTIDGNESFDDVGGGISSEADLTDIRSSTISDNTGNSTALGFSEGGGIHVGDQGDGDAATNEFILIDSIISGNSVDGIVDEGGGIYTQAGSSYIAKNEISGNSAVQGGGLKVNRGNALVINNTITGNTTSGNGGGVKVGATAFVYFIHNTITDNTATGGSRTGGIFFTNNGSADFRGNIIAENSSPTAGYEDCHTFLATLSSSGYNLLGINNQCSGFLTAQGSDTFGTSASPELADLAALSDNGGPSSPTDTPKTHAATVASTNVWEIIPAATCATTFNSTNYGAGGSVVDTTANPFGASIVTLFAAITSEDQRGATRPGMTDCEVGAWENASLATFDYGDAPDSYATLSASTGPFHTIDTDLLLGIAIDSDSDGQPGVNADGDDTNGTTPDDEDGISVGTLTETVASNVSVTVVNTTGANAYIQGWIDFDNNGTFDAGEQVATDVPANASGVFNISVTPPAGSAGNRYARFRLTPNAALGVGGDGGIGEVEDDRVTISSAPAAPTPSGGTSSGGGGGSVGSGGCAHISCFISPQDKSVENNEDALLEEEIIIEETEPSSKQTTNDNQDSCTATINKIVSLWTNQEISGSESVPVRDGLRVFTGPSGEEVIYPDFSQDHWGPYFLQIGTRNGIVEGYEDGLFRPDKNITTGEFAKILANALGIETSGNEELRETLESSEQQKWSQWLQGKPHWAFNYAFQMDATIDLFIGSNPEESVDHSEIIEIVAEAYGVTSSSLTHNFVSGDQEKETTRLEALTLAVSAYQNCTEEGPAWLNGKKNTSSLST